jgi:hypothetical protein
MAMAGKREAEVTNLGQDDYPKAKGILEVLQVQFSTRGELTT